MSVQTFSLAMFLCCALLACPSGVQAYEPEIHQQLTFIAAGQFNNCAHQHPDIRRLSALDTRYIVRSNVAQAQGGRFTRLFRWNYYNRADQTGRSLLGVIDTRFHDHFESLVDQSRWAVKRELQLKNLGRILSYVQDATSPARVVPVYTGRWWRWSFSDRFEHYPVDGEQVEAAVEGLCEDLLESNASFHDVLDDAANHTLRAVRAPIYGFPATWEAYWQAGSRAEEFGEYGPAGNAFGERTQFRCGDEQRCLLLDDDPLYHDFATARHIQAVISTLRALILMQVEVANAAGPDN